MDTLALDEIVPLKGSSVSIGAENTFRPSFRVADTDGADTALALVSEGGQAIRKLEKDSKEAVVRAHDAAMAVKTRLDQTVTRVEQAEAALRKAESEIDNLLDMVARANEEIENVRSLFADKERELVEMTERRLCRGTSQGRRQCCPANRRGDTHRNSHRAQHGWLGFSMNGQRLASARRS